MPSTKDSSQVLRGAGKLAAGSQTLFHSRFTPTVRRNTAFLCFPPQNTLSSPPPVNTVPSGSGPGGKLGVKEVVGWPEGKRKVPGTRHVP